MLNFADARRANFFFRPLFGFEFDIRSRAPRARRYRRPTRVHLKCASRAWRAGVYAATSCRARARVSAVAAPCASAHRGSVGRSSSALRHGPTPVEGWRQAQPWRYVGAGRTSAHNTCFLSLRARASRLRKHLTAPLRVRHLETSDDHRRHPSILHNNDARWSVTFLSGFSCAQ
jgi:hypothetical protein